ncbi:hypothetical protein V5799_015192 [Amblyomma americanum]|uniref:Uncharacterized protein n=1 Tax=Amblyomma americanum TaxID=6943 RepID=A0AAQ4E0W1_AMBAM
MSSSDINITNSTEFNNYDCVKDARDHWWREKLNCAMPPIPPYWMTVWGTTVSLTCLTFFVRRFVHVVELVLGRSLRILSLKVYDNVYIS